MALLGTLSSCFCVNVKLSLLLDALLGVMCLTLHPTSNAQQAHRLKVSCLEKTVKFIPSQLCFRDEGGGESNGCRRIGS